ncbi:hypothetical protein PS2_037425 [Malus domestica]
MRRNIEILVLRMNRRLRRRFWLPDRSFTALSSRRADSDSSFGHGLEVLILQVNGCVHRRRWLSGRWFAMVGRRKADLDSRLGHRRRLTVGTRTTRQRHFVTLLQNEDRGFCGSFLGRGDCLF